MRKIVPGKDTQRGYCHEIFVRADVRVTNFMSFDSFLFWNYENADALLKI